MLTLQEVETEALRIARERIGARKIDSVRAKEDQDSEGNESVSITIILKSPIRFSGNMLGNISLDLLNYMVQHQDDRYPYTHYATLKDLKMLAEADD